MLSSVSTPASTSPITMLKTPRLTAAVLITLSALMAACNPSEPPTTEVPSADASVTETQTPEPPQTPAIASLDNPDPTVSAAIAQYINTLSSQGFASENQGIWMQTGDSLLAHHQGTIPLPAASLTKVATSLVALQTFGPDGEFVTQIGATGPIENGELQGDLVIQGEGDPLFVWEEAIAIGNRLNEMGIQRVTGDLVITGKFYMNFETDAAIAGNLLLEGLNSQIWPSEAETQYQNLPPGTPKPQVAIAGIVRVAPTPPSPLQPLVSHYSLPVAELLKRMNQYSNNPMAEMFAEAVGGPQVVAQKAAAVAGVPPSEIQLINGSGLGEENIMSPRAACALFLALERYLQPYNMTIGDAIAIVGQDEGILNQRQIPRFSVVKSGSLNYVSALAGALPTQTRGSVWFVIMNGGSNLEGFRIQQETLLNQLVTQWGPVTALPPELTPNPLRKTKTSRSEIVKQ